MTMTSEHLWDIVAGGRDGLPATIGEEGIPQLSNIYYLFDPSDQLVRFSTTTVRIKGRNLLLNPRAALHVPGKDFFNFAVVSGPATLAVPMDPDDAAVEKLFAIHEGLGAASDRDGFGAQMLADHRMAVEFRVEHIYGQILDR